MTTRKMTGVKCFLAAMAMLLVSGAAIAQGAQRASAPPPGMVAGTPPPGCDCGPNHWWDDNRKSCVTGACDVPNMPDGDKGGGYFAWHGSLFINTPCIVHCTNLDKTVTTGQAGWMLVSGPGVSTPRAPTVVTPNPGWATIAGASWISVDANRGSQPGDYTYEFDFCLCAEAKSPKVTISFLADNGATISLNSSVLFSTSGSTNFKVPVKVVTYATVPGVWVIPGTNKIRVVVHNDSSVTGLIASLNISAQSGACAN
jgi:hypothetical protein